VAIPSVSFCVEQATATLAARAADLPLAGWLRSEARPRVDVNALLSGDPDEATRTARRRLSEGFRSFKLKVGRASPLETRILVRSVRDVIGSGTILRLDANRAWEFDDAAAILIELEDLDIAYVEEPLRDPAALSQLSRQTSVPLALDESVVEIALRGLEPDDFSFARAAVLKPTLLGGIRQVLRLAEAFAEAGIDPVVTSSFESAIGLFGLAAVAAACPGSGQAAGLDTLRFFETGLTRGKAMSVGPVLETDRPPPELGVDRARLERVY
jgi:O-succinylbenzoate synthase